MSTKPSIPARPSAKPAVPSRPSVPVKPSTPAKPGQGASQQGNAGQPQRAAVPQRSKSSQAKTPPSRVKQTIPVAGGGNRTPVGRTQQSLPTLNPVAVRVTDNAVGVSRSPQSSLLPPAAPVQPQKSEAAPASAGGQRPVVRVARVKRAKTADNKMRVNPSGLPNAAGFKPSKPPDLGSVTQSEINLLLEMDTNSDAKRQLMQRKQQTHAPVLSEADKEEMIARSMNEVVVKTAWERPADTKANPLAAKMQKELERIEKEKTSAEDAERWKELENDRLKHYKTMLETSQQVNNARLVELERAVAGLQEERDKYYNCCLALEQQCRSVLGLLEDGDSLLDRSLA